MATSRADSGLPSAFNGNDAAQQPGNLWRPWTGEPGPRVSLENVCAWKLRLIQALFWPKTRCFDYLYRDAEMLLRNYPVQATICLYEDSSSDENNEEEDEEDEEDEEIEEKLN
uniref:Ripply transcriptional repressor 2 n=1 Tax=Mola mola TaxID=94237 RepID=A0A3Q3WVV8_MOLML